MHYIIVQKGSVHYTDYIVQSSAANSLRFIIIIFPKPMELCCSGGQNQAHSWKQRGRKQGQCFRRVLAVYKNRPTLWLPIKFSGGGQAVALQ